MDTGNTITKMSGDVDQPPATARMVCRLFQRDQRRDHPGQRQNLHFTMREPYGVVGRIVPFNHPLSSRHASWRPADRRQHAVIKPPETSPLSATMLGEICKEVLPQGVANIVTGNGMPSGDALARSTRTSSASPSPAQCRPASRSSARRRKAVSRRFARAWRQESADRRCRTGPGQGRGRCGRRHELRLGGAILRLDQPAVAARGPLQDGARARCRESGGDQARRSDRSISRRWDR